MFFIDLKFSQVHLKYKKERSIFIFFKVKAHNSKNLLQHCPYLHVHEAALSLHFLFLHINTYSKDTFENSGPLSQTFNIQKASALLHHK